MIDSFASASASSLATARMRARAFVDAASGAERRPLAREGARRRALALRVAITGVLLSATLLQSTGINFGSYSLNAALLGMYLCLAVGAVFGGLGFSLRRLLLYVACVGVALASLLVNANFAGIERSSLSSYLLLVVMYFPFIFTLNEADDRGPGEGSLTTRWALEQYSNIALFCAFAGIGQFFAQFVIHADWLFNYSAYLPSFLQGPGGYNTVIHVGSWYKSNGFFFREPSGFSFTMALALVAEWELGGRHAAESGRRWVRLGAFGLALLLTYSGTGLLGLLIALLFPLGWKTVARLLLLAVGGAVALLVLGDALNLSFTLGRIHEFGQERSSAYIRYIAPARLVADTFTLDSWTPWLGQGPGAVFRQALSFEYHDPTWAKLLVEYGVVGAACFITLFATTLLGGGFPAPVSAALFAYWIGMGGHLLSPEVNFTTLALAGLLPVARASSARPAPRSAGLSRYRSQAWLSR
ncbi:MAG TPA: hypothetical protein VMG12_37480 [Polyangiaceae bacterium]|nr:hypothetical protein [Polyangiaceae bacterium]